MPGDAPRAVPEPDPVLADDRLVEAARAGSLRPDGPDLLARVLACLHDRAHGPGDDRPDGPAL